MPLFRREKLNFTIILLVFCHLTLGQSLTKFAENPKFQTRELEVTSEFGTLKTMIHVAEKDLARINEVEEIIKKDLLSVINYFEYVPKSTVHFNLDPYLKISNGNATVFPQNIINLYSHPAVENEHLAVMDNWMRSLILHEFVHILHLDQTRDYIKFGESIFGTFPKVITSIVPRWFTEGIATWAESKFLSSGRLHNRLLKREFLIKMNDPYFCQSIDCIDQPGVQPYGQMSYWFGAHFLNFIENNHPKAIKCLAEANSGAIPFNLSSAFDQCTGKNVYTQFSLFKEELKKEYADLTRMSDGEYVLTNLYGQDDLQKGLALANHFLVKSEDNKRFEALASYDLKTGKSVSQTYPFPIANLGDVLSFQNKEGDDEYLILTSFFEDPNFRLENRTFKWVNARTLKIEKNIELGHNPLMIKALNFDHFISISFENSRYVIREKKAGEIEKIMTMASDVTILNAAWSKGKEGLWLIGSTKEGNYLAVLDPKNFQFKVFLDSREHLDFEFVDGKILAKAKDKNFYLFNYSSSLGKVLRKKVSNDKAENIIKYFPNLVTNDEWKVSYSKSLSFKSETPENRLRYLLADSKEEAVLTKEIKEEEERQDVFVETKDYFNFNQFKPKWWFLNFSSSSNLNTFGVMTSASDSFNRHSIDMSLLSFSSTKETYYGGYLNYMFLQDQWANNVLINRTVSENEILKTPIEENEASFQTSLRILARRVTLIPGFDLSYEDQTGSVSTAELSKLSARLKIQYEAMSLTDAIQSISLFSRYGIRLPKVGQSFKDWYVQTSGRVNIWQDFSVNGKLNYGRLEKSGFDRGVLYGGGFTTNNTFRTYEFYGLNYGAVYGNEIIAARIAGDFRVFEFYRGYNLWPFFARDLRFIFGRDWISADRIIIGRQTLRDKAVNSVWAGANLKWTFAYNLPVETKLIFSKVFNPDGQDARETYFSIDAEVW